MLTYPKSSSLLRTALTLGAIVAGFAITGCVSQKKYDAALQDIARLSVDTTFQNYEISDVKYAKGGTIYKQQEELQAKSVKMDSIQALVAKQQNELQTRRNLIEKLRNSDWTTEVREDQLVITLKNDLVFGSGKGTLSPKGKVTIASVASALQQVDEPINVWVVGHTDNQPYKSDAKDNWDLSADRALAVVRGLIANKISPNVITASAKSEFDPRSPNTSELGRQLNRRTEIIIVSKESPYATLEGLIQTK